MTVRYQGVPLKKCPGVPVVEVEEAGSPHRKKHPGSPAEDRIVIPGTRRHSLFQSSVGFRVCIQMGNKID